MKCLQVLLIALLSCIGISAFSPSTARSLKHYRSNQAVRRNTSPRCSGSPLMMAGPATLEPTKTKEKKKTEEPVQDKQNQKDKGWEVRLWNDPMNKREYVARCLTEIVSLSDGSAYQVMMQAHQFGVAVIGTYHQERAELYRDSLLEHGLVVDMVPADDDD
mmetsp:Transcript_29722/g.64359  ORF Transcript_29722/g.64359 Transcript_29722/m.64359 type:complete len:161 (-) Transcript_29722:387-869(-)